MNSLGQRGDLHARRTAAAYVRHEIASVEETEDSVIVKSALTKLYCDLAHKYADRQGGVTRILKTAPRRGDGAHMVNFELVVILLKGLALEVHTL